MYVVIVCTTGDQNVVQLDYKKYLCIFRRPHSHKECQSYSYLSHLGTQDTELTEAKESAYCHVRFSSHSDSGIT